MITRCRDLFEKYGKGLCNFKISLYHLKIMSDDEWEEWFKEFDKLFNKINVNENICKYKYKNGNFCSKMNCKIKHKSTIWLSDKDDIFCEYDSGYESGDSIKEDNIVDYIFINEDIFYIDINYNIDEYSDKYNNIFINEIDTKFHMGLCTEKECQNKSEPNEDICIQCFNKEKYETDNEEIYEMNLNKYSKIYMEDILNEFIMNKSKNIIKNIINKNNNFDIKTILN